MLKKLVILSVTAVIVLASTENLVARENFGYPRQFRRSQHRPTAEQFDGWLEEFAQAYRNNDRGKTDQLLRKMHQFKQRRPQKRRGFPCECRPNFHNRAGTERGRPGQFRNRPNQYPQTRDMGGRNRGCRAEGMGRRGQDFKHRGMSGWNRGSRHRNTSRRGRDFQHRSMDRWDEHSPPRNMRKQRKEQDESGFNWDW